MPSLLYLDVSMLIVQVFQRYRLVATHPNKVRSFSVATVHTAAENVGREARRVGRHTGYTRVSKSGDDGEVEASWERCTHDGGNERQETGWQQELSDGESVRQRRTSA